MEKFVQHLANAKQQDDEVDDEVDDELVNELVGIINVLQLILTMRTTV